MRSVQLAKKNKQLPKRLVPLLAYGFLILFLTYFLSSVTIRIIKNDYLVTDHVCSNSKDISTENNTPYPVLVYRAYIIYILFTLMSVFATQKTASIIKSSIISTDLLTSSNNQESYRDHLKVPLQATLYSILLGIPFLFLHVIFVSPIAIVMRHQTIIVLFEVTNVIRLPVSVFLMLAQKRKAEEEFINCNDRERRRQKEIMWAKRSRQERMQQKQNVNNIQWLMPDYNRHNIAEHSFTLPSCNVMQTDITVVHM